MIKNQEKEIIFVARNENGFLAERLGRGLQNLVRRFESARNLRILLCFQNPTRANASNFSVKSLLRVARSAFRSIKIESEIVRSACTEYDTKPTKKTCGQEYITPVDTCRLSVI